MTQVFLSNGGVVQRLNNGTLIPYPYEVWSDGVYSVGKQAKNADPDETVPLPESLNFSRKRILTRPIWVSSVGKAVDTEEPLVQLTYMNVQYQPKSIWLSRAQITDTRVMTILGAQGLPVDSENVKQAMVYMREVEALNGPLLPMLLVGSRSGPYFADPTDPTKMGWLIGAQWIGSGHLEPDPRNGARYTAAFRAHGSADEWNKKWREVRENWVPRFMMGATFAPPLLRLLKCRTFIVHHWGQSGVGKTAAAVFAISAWGNPELLYSSLNRTEISITEVFKHMTDVPVLFDEKQVSTVKSDQLIYSVCAGSGRERGARDGGLRQDKQSWLTIARTTGEVPLVTNSDLGGQFNRLLQIHSPSFRDKREAESIYPFTAEHHGHAGPEFLRRLAALLAMPAGLSLLQNMCRDLREKLTERMGADSNHCQYGAVIATAQALSEHWLLGIDLLEARERALDDAHLAIIETAPQKQQTYAERALSKLRDHWISNPAVYVDDTTAEGRSVAHKLYRMVGIETAFGMAYVPHEANEILVKAQYEPERVWRDFHAQGWLVVNPSTPDNPLTTMALRNGKSPDHPVYVIKPNIFFASNEHRHLRLLQGGVTGLESV